MFSKRPIRTLAPKDQIPKWVSGLLYFQQEGTRSGQRPLAMRREVLKGWEPERCQNQKFLRSVPEPPDS